MKIGDKIPIVLTVVRQAIHGEKVKSDNGEEFALMNLRGNKFWASTTGRDNGTMILVCDDHLETEASLIKRRAIVDLIECGVGA